MPEHETPTPKRIACGDVVPGCTFTASAPTEEELIQKVVAHAAHDHGDAANHAGVGADAGAC
jgi:predicted small metal-binding protein